MRRRVLVLTTPHPHLGQRLGVIYRIEQGYLFGTVYWVAFADGSRDHLLAEQFTTHLEEAT